MQLIKIYLCSVSLSFTYHNNVDMFSAEHEACRYLVDTPKPNRTEIKLNNGVSFVFESVPLRKQQVRHVLTLKYIFTLFVKRAHCHHGSATKARR